MRNYRIGEVEMKITKKHSISALAVAAAVLSTGTYYIIDTSINTNKQVHAYTSPDNTQDPATAPDSYVVTIPDVNLKTELNKMIDPTRPADNAITAGEIRTISQYNNKLDFRGKAISNLEGLQFFGTAGSILKYIDISDLAITTIAPLSDIATLEGLYMPKTQVSDLTPLAGLTSLKDLYIDETPVASLDPLKNLVNLENLSLYKAHNFSDASPLKNLVNLKYVSISDTNIADLTPFKDALGMERLHLGDAKVYDLSPIVNLTALTELNSYGQKHAITFNDNNPVYKNPIIGINGATVPIVETSKIKNANADGTLNPTGEYIKLVDTYDQGTTTVNWNTTFSHGTMTNVPFSGVLTINYKLPPQDVTGPVFTPAAPAKIVARKGTAITIDDVTAQDPSGLDASGVTNNAAAIGLDPANPAAGNYTLTYSATDTASNTSTVDREVEITDADALQAKVNATTDDSLKGHTSATQDAVKQKRNAANAIIANPVATQAQIDQALQDLQQAINGLIVDKQPLEDAKAAHDAEVSEVQNDPAVVAALAEVNRVNGLASPTVAEVKTAAEALIQALADARNAYNAAHPAQPLPPAGSPANNSGQATNNGSTQAPNTGHERITDKGLIATALGGVSATIGAIVLAIRKRRG